MVQNTLELHVSKAQVLQQQNITHMIKSNLCSTRKTFCIYIRRLHNSVCHMIWPYLFYSHLSITTPTPNQCSGWPILDILEFIIKTLPIRFYWCRIVCSMQILWIAELSIRSAILEYLCLYIRFFAVINSITSHWPYKCMFTPTSNPFDQMEAEQFFSLIDGQTKEPIYFYVQSASCTDKKKYHDLM